MTLPQLTLIIINFLSYLFSLGTRFFPNEVADDHFQSPSDYLCWNYIPNDMRTGDGIHFPGLIRINYPQLFFATMNATGKNFII